jgi:hypothetical protein
MVRRFGPSFPLSWVSSKSCPRSSRVLLNSLGLECFLFRVVLFFDRAVKIVRLFCVKYFRSSRHRRIRGLDGRSCKNEWQEELLQPNAFLGQEVFKLHAHTIGLDGSNHSRS